MWDRRKHFFISYNSAEASWASWVAQELKKAKLSSILQAWNAQSESSFIQEMGRAAKEAKCTIVLLSSSYLNAIAGQHEWVEVFKQKVGQGILLPIRVQDCKVEDVLGQLEYINLAGQEGPLASEKLLDGVVHKDNNLIAQPAFAGRAPSSTQKVTAPSPGSPLEATVLVNSLHRPRW